MVGRAFHLPSDSLCLWTHIPVSPVAVTSPPLLHPLPGSRCSVDQGRGDPATYTLFPCCLWTLSEQRARREHVFLTQAPFSPFLSELLHAAWDSFTKERDKIQGEEVKQSLGSCCWSVEQCALAECADIPALTASTVGSLPNSPLLNSIPPAASLSLRVSHWFGGSTPPRNDAQGR